MRWLQGYRRDESSLMTLLRRRVSLARGGGFTRPPLSSAGLVASQRRL